jgi:hypothetical protein
MSRLQASLAEAKSGKAGSGKKRVAKAPRAGGGTRSRQKKTA